MYSYQINPDLHTSNTLTKIAQIHNHNTRLASRMNYSLPKKTNGTEKHTDQRFGKTLQQNLNH